ncbi:MAG: PAS domain-containing protein [Treponemataceae bacterium]|nr:PAS domain-containing protein [Treponemataceae bacterium]
MNFLYPIYTEQTECQDCYKCIRQCPVKAIRVENGHAMVVSELCIMCGNCVINCSAKAKHVRDDVPKARQLIQLKKRVIVSLAPSFSSEFPEFTPNQIVAALKKLGFWGVSETALGADFVSAYLAEEFKKAKENKTEQKLFLSSACPSVVEFIKQFMSDYSPYITDCASPLLAHARYLKKIYGDDIGIIFIGPCIAKKGEADSFAEIDAAVTFENLRKWLENEGITPFNCIPKEDDRFIPQKAALGALYPVDGGMISSINTYQNSIRSLSVSGIKQIEEALKGLDIDSLKEPLFIELLACKGGCINGPVTKRKSAAALRHVQIMQYADSAEKTLNKNALEQMPEMKGTLPINAMPKISHTDEEIRDALRSVGKYSAIDEVNCASCGYDTCRAFAEAMLDNRAEKTMCVSYMRKLAQKKANGLIKTIPGGVVIADKDLKIVECNENFARLLGSDVLEMYEIKPGMEGADLDKLAGFARFFSDVISINGPDVIERDIREGKKIFHVSVFAIEKESIAGGVIEDVTAPEVQKHRIISQAKKVIDKNLSVVQQIAFLLGENAAESEAILNSIIESFSEDEDEQ